MKKNKNKEAKLKDSLVLNDFLLKLFNKKSLNELSKNLKEISLEGYDENNISKYYYSLISQLFDTTEISKNQLLVYDQNIYSHTIKISENQHKPIVWKYFQYLALLFTEIYLDKYFSSPDKLLNDLNELINEKYKGNVEPYTKEDLNKLAFWSATGSGKTLIMHVNIYQYMFYAEKHKKLRDINRIILLTPNEGLSKQHLSELIKSGFSAELFNKSGANIIGDKIVEVIDIHKLEEKEGEKTVAIESFESNNLVLVDEGHRGASGDDWKIKRDMLSEKGFSFEYSATFGQAISAANGTKKRSLLNEYAKCTLFDYSYKYFYEDGYGKNYHILNLNDTWNEHTIDLYFTACLLNYYQQIKIYYVENKQARLFLIEKPLFIFVGSKVTAVRKENKQNVSDVIRVLQFFNSFIKNKSKSIEAIRLLLQGNDGLIDKNNKSIFRNSFTFINDHYKIMDNVYETIYNDLLQLVFNSNLSGAELHLDNLKGAEGEIGMRVGDSDYFGVINVGDDTELLKLCEENGFNTTQKDFSKSLFHNINEENSKINLLIGSKKFSEGWNSWRVSTMGLMNVGRGEGTEIIQLFGRGVRLKGYKYSLKRSIRLDDEIKPSKISKNLKNLETLYVFGIRADYMDKFKEYLEEEGVPRDTSEEEQIDIKVFPSVELINKNKLKIVKVKDGVDFKKEVLFELSNNVKDNIKVILDWYPKIQILNRRTEQNSEKIDLRKEGKLTEAHLRFLDWDKIYFEIIKYKNERNWYNISISQSVLKNIMADNGWYTLLIPEYELKFSNFKQTFIWQEITISLLKNYLDKFYNYEKNKYLSKFLESTILTPEHPNFIKEYQILIKKEEEQLIENIKKVKDELSDEKLNDDINFNSFYLINFSKHLYKPLIYFSPGKLNTIKILPMQLVDSEKAFVEDLRRYYEMNNEFFKDKELFLLRNLSRKGISFFEANNFYPDFILWILYNNKQYVSFIDPKGLRQVNGFENAKIKFCKEIKNIQQRINDDELILNSFIVTQTTFNEIKHWQGGDKKENFEAHNVYFQKEDKEYIKKIIEKSIQ
jgi:hypothetical protein